VARAPAEDTRIRLLEKQIADNPNDPKGYCELGRVFLAWEDWHNAVRVLEKGLSLDTSLHQAAFELGCAYSRLHNWDTAIRTWERICDADGELCLDNIDYTRQSLIRGTVGAWEKYDDSRDKSIFKSYNLGIGHLLLGKVEAAIHYFTEVITANPHFEKALYYRTRANRMLGRTKLAGMDLQKLLEHRPRDPYGNYLLGLCLSEVGRTPQALSCFAKALVDKPGYYKAHHQAAEGYLKLQQFDQAVDHFKKAAQIRPHACEAYLGMGRCYEQQFRMEEAVEAFEKAVAADPENKDAHFSLGLLFKNLGRHPSAIRHLQKTVELDPSESEAYYVLGVLQSGVKKYQEAIIPLRKCLELAPNHAYARYTLGKACLAVENVEDAIECFHHALQQNPNDVKTLTALGMAHFQKKQLDQARKQFIEVLDRNPREAEAHYYLGATMFQLNDYDKAIESYQKASQVHGDSALNFFTSGALHSYRKQYEQALTMFRKATELRPDSEADISRFATLQLLATVGITHAQTGIELQTFIERRKDLFKSIVRTLASLLDARDQYTRYHSWRVATIGAMLARYIGLPDDEVEGIEMGGLLHDVGKIGIPEKILNKPGKLDEHEYEWIKRHPIIGWESLKEVEFPWVQVMPIVRYHHEKWNGHGYPDGLAGDDIPFEAQIIGIADFFDALTTNRPYRRAFSYQEALNIMRKESGTFFNPALLEEFAEVADTNEFILELPTPAEMDESGNHILPSMEENWQSLAGRSRDSVSDSWGLTALPH
jgi:HD-GYP domain-containing protein (c-di-GMP phosphodiesterase class II)